MLPAIPLLCTLVLATVQPGHCDSAERPRSLQKRESTATHRVDSQRNPAPFRKRGDTSELFRDAATRSDRRHVKRTIPGTIPKDAIIKEMVDTHWKLNAALRFQQRRLEVARNGYSKHFAMRETDAASRRKLHEKVKQAVAKIERSPSKMCTELSKPHATTLVQNEMDKSARALAKEYMARYYPSVCLHDRLMNHVDDNSLRRQHGTNLDYVTARQHEAEMQYEAEKEHGNGKAEHANGKLEPLETTSEQTEMEKSLVRRRDVIGQGTFL